MTAAIEVVKLTKRFGDTTALGGVSLNAVPGEVLGLLGPNGAGKTTLVHILCTLEQPDGGRAAIYGHDVTRQARTVRGLIAVTGQFTAVDEDLPGRENLYLVARLLGLPARRARARADEMLEQLGLTEAAQRVTRHYSGGMRRRLDLAASLIGDPYVLFLDEPTTGLDPQSRNEIWEIVRQRARAGTTVLLTTQYMDEAEALADRVVVIDHGQVIAGGTAAQLRSRYSGRMLRVRVGRAEHRQWLADELGAIVEENTDSVRLPITSDRHLSEVLVLLGSSAIEVLEIDTNPPTLDEVFLALTMGTSVPTRAGSS